MTPLARWLTIFAVIAWLPAAEAAGSPREAQLPAPLLDVPYLSQTEALCGGAALAMVLRYWGERDVFGQDFASLLDTRERGIRTSALVSAIRNRDWQAIVGSTAVAQLDADFASHVARGRPVIALLEERPNRYHYVVVIGVTDRTVVVHDPARAPFRVLSREEFGRRSAAAGNWMLIVLPPVELRRAAHVVPAATVEPIAPPSANRPCGELVERAVARGRAGDLAAAERELISAREQCPDEAAPLVELAGVRFLQSRWREARELSERAVKLAPAERQAWELLAGSRFLEGDLAGALDAWNHVGEPRADLIDVKGIARTRYPVVVSMLEMHPRQLLTADAFRQAARRLDALPAASATSLRYEPQDDGTARVTASAAEREMLPRGLVPLAAIGAQAAITREVRVDVVSPTGSGEVWTGGWRWPSKRRRLALQLAAPSPGWLPGVTTADLSWERQTYRAGPGAPDPTFAAVRRHAGVSVSDWISGRVQLRAGGAYDRFDTVATASLSGGGEIRLAGDRVAVGASGAIWQPFGGGRHFTAGTISGQWTSRLDTSAPLLSANAGVTVASRDAPLALWPGAGARYGRDVVLRGHLLVEDDVITGEVFGRRLAYATVEYEHPLRDLPFARISAAVFADTARAWHRLGGAPPSILHVDVGGGLRVNAPGIGGRVRLDVGWGLRDGNVVVSAGWATR